MKRYLTDSRDIGITSVEYVRTNLLFINYLLLKIIKLHLKYFIF